MPRPPQANTIRPSTNPICNQYSMRWHEAPRLRTFRADGPARPYPLEPSPPHVGRNSSRPCVVLRPALHQCR
eukprot:7756456-Alexandrium_andersonii.AAC.1